MIILLTHLLLSCHLPEKAECYQDYSVSLFRKNKTGQFRSINQVVTNMNKVKPENTSNTFVYAALLTVIALGFSYYTYKRVKILETKRKLLENETEILKIQVHDKLFDEVVELAKKNDSAFFTKFIALYPDFISELQKINPDLKRSELMFCAMLKLNFSSKEIASITGVLHTSIQKRKNKIRKRLNISSDADIYYFFDQLG